MLRSKYIVSISILLVAVLLLPGCYKTTTIVQNPGASITREISFSKDLVPIFTKSCAIAGCHVSGAKAPDLTVANAFKSLSAGSYFKEKDPENSLLMLWLNGKKSPVMPLGNGPNQEINAQVYAWINQGAKNN